MASDEHRGTLDAGAGTDARPHRLVLVSRSVLPGSLDARAAALADLFAAGRRRNAADGLTGILALNRGWFLLALEGPGPALAATGARIRADLRHAEIRFLAQGPVPERRLPDTPMLLVGPDPRTRALFAPLLDRLDGAPAPPGPPGGARGDEPAVADEPPVAAEAVVEALCAAAREAPCPEIPGDAPAAAPEGRAAAGPRRDAAGLQAELARALAEPPGEAAQDGAARDEVAQDGAAPAQASAEPPAPEAEALDAAFATAVLSADGRILRANATYCAVLDHPAGALAGRSYRDVLHAADAARLDRLWQALARGETVRLDRRGLRRDGREVWMRSVYRPRRDGAGVLRDVTEITTDVTDQQRRHADDRGQIRAINKAQLVVHFDLDGTILDANDLFLKAMGYRRDEVVGRHHRMFVGAGEAGDADYAAFWAALAAGEPRSAEFRRMAAGGRPVWLQATYNPIVDMGGRPFKVVTYATDVTAARLRQADYQWQIAAIHKSHAVITFDMDAIVLDANPLFLEAMGYGLDEVVGRHHRMFVDPSYVHGADYAAFWRGLAAGRHQAGQFRRVGRAGREVWLQASYNPIFDMDGRPFKVVTYATVVTEDRLRQAEHQGQIAAIHKAQAVIAFDLDGTVLDANDNFLDAMGYRLAEVRGRHHRMFVDPAEAAGAPYAAFWARLAAGHHMSGEFQRVGRDGRAVWLQASYNPIFDMNGRPFRIVKYAVDVTAAKLRQADIDGQIRAIDRSQGMIAYALDGTVIEANANALAMLGYAREELVGRHHTVLVEGDHAASQDYAAFWRTLCSGRFAAGRYRRVGRDGRAVWLQANYNPILGMDGRPFKIIELATDVTADVSLAEAYEDAKRQAQHDAATALPNRVRLAADMAAALAQPGARLVVLYLDLDRFKPINDTFGHHVGDRVLGEVADRLRRVLAADQVAARIGGDEFVVMAPDLPDEAIEPFCQRLIAAVSAPIRHEAGELTVGVSIGVAVSPADGGSPDALLRAADAALYRSKQGGRGTFSFYAAPMNERILAYRSLVEDMRRALAAGEFFLEYQPRFGARDQTLRSVEALVRWAHPQRGRIPPGDFIPLAEKSGLIVGLGAWVLREACRAATAWAEIRVSVNVSPVQFRSGDVVALVTAALAETGLDPHRLELEITEGMLLEDADRAREALSGLKRLGVRLAMDDFGTGYSSLSSLRSFPFDVIKIDRQFVADIDSRDGGREVVQAILGLGRALGLSVTAEGVETADQLAILADDACEEVQGYYLARPMAAGQIADLLTRSAQAADAA